MSAIAMRPHPLVVLATVAILASGAALADTLPAGRSRTLSVEQAMELARQRSEGANAARAAARGAQARVSAAKSAWLPQVSGSANYDRTLASEYDDLFAPAPDGMTEGEGLGDLPFGQKNIWRLGLSLSQEIWSFGKTARRVDLAMSGATQATLAAKSAAAQAALVTAQAYYDALLAQELLAIAALALTQAEETLRITQLSFDQGSMPEFDLLRAQVTRDNQTSAVTQQKAAHALAVLHLKQVTGLDLDLDLTLTTPLDENTQAIAERHGADPAGTLEVKSSIDASRDRTPVRGTREGIRQGELGVRLAKAANLPNVTLTSNYGLVNYPDGVFPGFGDWRTNWTVGVSLTVPLFTGWRLSSEVDVARAELSAARYRHSESLRAAAVERVSSQQNLAVALATWKQSSRTVEQAQRAYEIAELRFEKGLSTYVDLVASRVSLDQARVNRARASRDVHVADIREHLLPELPLGTSGGAPAAAPPSSTSQSQGAPAESAQGFSADAPLAP